MPSDDGDSGDGMKWGLMTVMLVLVVVVSFDFQ